MSTEEKLVTFAVPREDTPMDMSLSEEERLRRAAFYKRVEELKAVDEEVMDCPKCLMVFSDALLHRVHMMMHSIGPSPSAPWLCSICKRQCADRRQFQLHTIKYAHALIPPGTILPPSVTFSYGLPDLASLCPPSALLDRIIEMIRSNKKQ